MDSKNSQAMYSDWRLDVLDGVLFFIVGSLRSFNDILICSISTANDSENVCSVSGNLYWRTGAAATAAVLQENSSGGGYF